MLKPRSKFRRNLLIESLESRQLLAADYSVIDTNPSGSGILFDKTAVVGTDLYFVDSDTTVGAELRRLDTTTGQVSLVADINPGIGDSITLQNGLELAGERLYFFAYDPVRGDELRWFNVNESEATVHTLDILLGIEGSNESQMGGLFGIGDKLYFSAVDQTNTRSKLRWIDTTTDSPVLNTVDIEIDYINQVYDPEDVNFTAVGNLLYFNAFDQTYGEELRWIDTATAPSIVHTKDLTAGSDSSWTTLDFTGIVTAADKVFVSIPSRNLTYCLDASQPTTISRTYSGLGSLFSTNDRVYSYVPNSNGQGGEVVWLDATQRVPAPNTITVAGNQPPGRQSNIAWVAGSKVFVSIGDWTDTDNGLYWIDLSRSNPTIREFSFTSESGIIQDPYINQTVGPSAGFNFKPPYGLTNFQFLNGKLYFNANDDLGVELRWIDVNESVPVVHTLDISLQNKLKGNIKSSYPGRFGGLIPIGDKLFFVADDANELELDPAGLYFEFGRSKLRWIDTLATTPSVNTIELHASKDGAPGDMGGFIQVGSRLVFNAKSGEGYKTLTTSWFDTNDPTATVHKITDGINTRWTTIRGYEYLYKNGFASFGNKVFFDSSGQLQSYDFSTELLQTIPIDNPALKSYAGRYGGYVSAGNKIFFFAGNDPNQPTLRWIDASQDSPTVHTIDVVGSFQYSALIAGDLQPDNFFYLDGTRLYFNGRNKNGSGEGVKWIDTSVDNPTVHSLGVAVSHLVDRVIPAGDKLYFLGNGAFWIDRNESSPQVHRINLYQTPSVSFIPKLVGDKLYFDVGQSLCWIDTVSDPSTAIALAGDYRIVDDWYTSTPRELGVVGTKLFFDATSDGMGNELRWIDTSSATPTINTIEMNVGPKDSATGIYTSFDSKVFFVSRFDMQWIDTLDPSLEIHTINVSGRWSSISFHVLNRFPDKVIVNDKLYFPAIKPGLGSELIAVQLRHDPSDIDISQNVFNEDVSTGTELATLSSEDVDLGSTFAYSLVAGDGDADNDLFLIVNDKLVLKTALDFETKPTYSLRVRTTDSTNRSFEKTLFISVLEVPEAPTAGLDNYDVPINFQAIAIDALGTLTTSTADNGVLANDYDSDGDSFTLELLKTPIHGTLTFNSNGTFRYKPASNAQIGQKETFTYRITDTTGRSSESTVTLTISGRVDSPLYNKSTPLDVVRGTVAGAISTLDALAIINLLNANRGRGSIPVEQLLPTDIFYDVNNDFFVTSLDVLAIINYLNARSRGLVAEGPLDSDPTSNAMEEAHQFDPVLLDAAMIDFEDLSKKRKR